MGNLITIHRTDEQLRALRQRLFSLRTTFSLQLPDVQREANSDVVNELINVIEGMLPPPKIVEVKQYVVTFHNRSVGDPTKPRVPFINGPFIDCDDAEETASQYRNRSGYTCVQVHALNVEVPSYD